MANSNHTGSKVKFNFLPPREDVPNVAMLELQRLMDTEIRRLEVERLERTRQAF